MFVNSIKTIQRSVPFIFKLCLLLLTRTALSYMTDGTIIACGMLLFGLMLHVPVNSYAHVGKVSSPSHIFPGQA